MNYKVMIFVIVLPIYASAAMSGSGPQRAESLELEAAFGSLTSSYSERRDSNAVSSGDTAVLIRVVGDLMAMQKESNERQKNMVLRQKDMVGAISRLSKQLTLTQQRLSRLEQQAEAFQAKIADIGKK